MASQRGKDNQTGIEVIEEGIPADPLMMGTTSFEFTQGLLTSMMQLLEAR